MSLGLNLSADKKTFFLLSASLLWISSVALAAGPYSESEIRSVQSPEEAKIQDLRSQEIQQLRITLGRRLPSNRQADLYFRLAESYLENYRSEFLFEGRAHEKRIEKGEKEPSIRRERSKPYLSLGIKACEDIVKLKIPFDRLDQVYYFLGFNYGELGDRKKSKNYYEMLTHRFPKSIFAIEGQRALGEYAFSEKDFKKAKSYFETASQNESAENLPRILYKLAWAHYRLRNYSQAVSTMKQAVAKAQETGEKFLILREEALRDMAIFLTETGKAEDAVEYFEKVAGDKNYYPKVLERMAQQYERSGRIPLAIQVYHSLLKVKTDENAQFRTRVKLFEVDIKRNRPDVALNNFKGQKLPDSDEQETAQAYSLLKSNVRKVALDQHQRYRKQNDKASLKLADQYYSFYIERFYPEIDKKNVESVEVRMYLAEIKREEGLSREASAIYKSIVDSGEAKFAKEAGSLWTASLAEALKKEASSSKPSSAAGGAPGKPSDREMEFVEASDALQKNLGKTDQAREVALRAAQILAGYSETRREGYDRASKIIEDAPSSPQALIAARLCLQLTADERNGTPEADLKLKRFMDEIRANEPLMKADQKGPSKTEQGKLALFLDELDGKFKLEKISTAEKHKDYSKAAEGYEEFAQSSKKPEAVEKALESAFNSYLKAQDYVSVSRVSSQWLKRFPHHPKAIDGLRVAATSALIQGKWSESAGLFQSLSAAQKNPDPGALLLAARIYEGNRQLPEAQTLRLNYIKNFPKEIDVPTLILALAQASEAEGKDSVASQYYQKCAQAKSAVAPECFLRLGDLYWKSKDRDNAVASYQKASRIDSASPYVGYARYKLAELEESQVQLAPLTLPEDKLKVGINQRIEFLKKITQSYQKVVDAGGPWAIAALGRLANFTAKFANDMDAIAGSEAFKKGVKGISDPLRQKAAETWKKAFDIAVKAEVLSPSLAEIVDEIADSRHSPPARAQGARGGFRLAGISPSDQKSLPQVREKLTQNAKDAAAWMDYGNLLWGEGHPLLAQIAYERAAVLDPKNVASLNNQAVVLLSAAGAEDWAKAAQASLMFKKVIDMDHFFIPAKLNRGLLFAYYRIFPKAQSLLEQVQVKAKINEAEEGLMISEIGLSDVNWTADKIKSSNPFVAKYHQTAVELIARKIDASDCVSRMKDLMSDHPLQGFELASAQRLQKRCELWKEKN